MKLSSRWHRAACLVAPLALVLGVAVQRYHVETYDQTPWAGGGFGMFSTVDVPGGRAIRAYLLTDDGPVLIMEPNLAAPTRLVYTQPKPERVAAAAHRLASLSWQVYEAEAYPSIRGSLPDFFQSYLDRAAAWDNGMADSSGVRYPDRIAFDSRRAPRERVGSVPTVRSVRVEVWKPYFDRAAERLRWEQIAAATAEVPTR